MTFSSQTFSIDYFVKRRVDYKGLLTQASSSESLRALGRSFGVSCGSIQNRLDRLSRQALALHARLRVLADPRESVCADGFVHFEVSRYFPSETVISITSNSRFILDLSHATRRRSGAMTSYQRARAEKLFTTFEFERGAVTRGFCDILDSLARERPPARMRPLVLVTDEKPEYDYAFGRHRLFREQDEDRRTVRIKVNSGMPRTCSNPLFASNYLDRELRKDLAGCRRDAFCFSRNVSNAMARLSCYIVEHNYRKRFRIKAPVLDRRVHGEAAGIARAKIDRSLEQMFYEREFLTRVSLPLTLMRIWKRDFITPLKRRPERLPAYAMA